MKNQFNSTIDIKRCLFISVQNATLQWKPEGITVAGTTNVFGTAANLLNSPIHVALDYLNSMYISDTLNNRIQKYLYGAISGATVTGLSNGSWVINSYGLYYPSHITIDSSENLYVTDMGANRIQLWKRNGSDHQTVAGVGSGIFLLLKCKQSQSPIALYEQVHLEMQAIS